MIITPNTFEEHVAQVAQRAQFLLALAPAVVNSTVLDKPGQVAVAQLAHKWDSLLPQRSVHETASSDKTVTTVPSDSAQGTPTKKEGGNAEKKESKEQKTNIAGIKGTDLLRYLKLGHTAPPSILVRLLARRQHRAKERAAG